MQKWLFLPITIFLLSCNAGKNRAPYTSVEIELLYSDSLSIRAIGLMGHSLAFAADKGAFGTIDLNSGKIRSKIEKYHTSIPEFRAVAHNATDFFILSIGNPALLYKTGEDDKMDLVYKEEGDGVFYDSMTFWNNREGIAIGDSREGCLSIIVTRDGGHHWNKILCSDLPKSLEGEGAFAASNTNIKVIGDKTWVATTGGRIYYSPDKGRSWSVTQTPIQNKLPTQGIYSMDFYDRDLGIVFGGDYTKPSEQIGNKAITTNGGKSWSLIADGDPPGYESCVQFVPGSGGKEIVAVGFTGISYSRDRGKTWKTLSKEPFYSLRFASCTVAYASGKGRIARILFKT
ncbi:MAG: oxidoreductase [Bacteroidota bacterium]